MEAPGKPLVSRQSGPLYDPLSKDCVCEEMGATGKVFINLTPKEMKICLLKKAKKKKTKN